MTNLQKLQLRQSELRSKVLDFVELEQRSADGLNADQTATYAALTAEMKENETKIQAAMRAESEPSTSDDPETRELHEIRERVSMSAYVNAAIERRGIAGGPELEYNQALGVPGDHFPMRLLEQRAAIAGDAQSNQQTWIDRVFAESAAARVGVSFQTVAPGIASVPVTTAGATGAQRGNAQAAANATYTVGVSELKPKRNAVHTIFSVQDSMRLPGLEDAIVRDLRAAVVDAVDKAVFVGDATANPNDGDIVGFQTAGVSEVTITQANKLLATGVLAAFAGLIDGQYAAGMGDLRTILAVGANGLWAATIPNAATGNNASIAQILAGNGVSWQVRAGIEGATSAGDFGAFIGLNRGIAGAATAAVWDAGQLIRDPYSDADSGEVRLTLNYLWDFAVPRTDSFKRIKFVA